MQIQQQTDAQLRLQTDGAVRDDPIVRADQTDHTGPDFDQMMVSLRHEPDAPGFGGEFGLPYSAIGNPQNPRSDFLDTGGEVFEALLFEDAIAKTDAQSELNTEKVVLDSLPAINDIKDISSSSQSPSIARTTKPENLPAAKNSTLGTINSDLDTLLKHASSPEVQLRVPSSQQAATTFVQLENVENSQSALAVSSNDNQSLIRPDQLETDTSRTKASRVREAHNPTAGGEMAEEIYGKRPPIIGFASAARRSEIDAFNPPALSLIQAEEVSNIQRQNLVTTLNSLQSADATITSEITGGDSTLFNISLEETTSNAHNVNVEAKLTVDPNSMVSRPEPGPTRTEIGRNIAQQLANVAKIQQDQPVELNLSPEELGLVQLTVMTSESGVMVTLNAERSETLELMRRHIEFLTQEFGDIGFSDVTFNFGQSHQNSEDVPEQEASSTGSAQTDTATASRNHLKLTLDRAEELDLRL
ncbi:flagellar hook-length control protein FliK [Pseudohalocynthiibacter aestuariivivens]|jgi:Flagellar hook-length control protein FliK|uniref:Flagellar hook-length control protein FliK n=1 Tax=Pseudohalocynthiibacter aestuariivivens TaxID=1591409 RepID=A0ABV5JK61_9RHOB|nr:MULTISPECIES: flagellar hook-length control protein FliK [Pseudohalocynthiibacter]MBS9717724.1 flagellar hook-length control protein FliK [Pseudohalocynthiibacter aestuariivivens]MCK0102924.1 flagellar hook-length control protein FliK [Pseudohalocynthiibacter sp. F2068]